MKQLIDKSALVAEIERRRKDWRYGSSIEAKYKREECDDILSFLDTLEVKEVDLEKELDKYTADNFWALEGNNESPYLLEKDDMLKVAKYFYELGLKAKGE